MSNLASMSFKTFTFPHNPVKLTVTDEKAVKETVIPFFGTCTEQLGQRKRRVTCEGWLIGDDCWQQWERLQAVCGEDTPGALRLPWQLPFAAVAEQLHFLGASGAGAVKYSVTFVEWNAQTETVPVTLTAQEGDSLWDYAHRFGKGISALVAANPTVRDIDCLPAGQQVVIA